MVRGKRHLVYETRLEVHAGGVPPGRYVRLVGELDLATASEFERAVADISHGDVVVDVSRLEFVDAAGLRALASLRNRLATDGGGQVVLRSPRPAIRRVLTIANVVDLFHLED
jgi:anti-anti-sigma factor